MKHRRFPYSAGAIPMPYVEAELVHGEDISRGHFLVDSGCAVSLAPTTHAPSPLILASVAEVPVPGGVRDLNGQPIRGKPIGVEVRISGLDPFHEIIYFGTTTEFAVLGQDSFFQHWGVTLRRFVREFAIFEPAAR